MVRIGAVGSLQTNRRELTLSASQDPIRWDEYVRNAEGASLYHLFGWKRVIEDTFGHRAFYLSVAAGPDIVGVLPLVELKSRIFGHMLVSLPFFNYGGMCADNDTARGVLLGGAIEVARDTRADFIEIRHDDEWSPGLPVKTGKVSMRLALPSGSDELWKALGSKLRNQVQRPCKEGMTARIGREDQLDAFYDVFAANMRDLGTPVYAKGFFLNILRAFPDRTWITTVYAGDKAVAAGFLAGFRDRLEIPWASSLKAFNRMSPNMLLYWSALEFACAHSYRIFDFGRSTPSEGTYKFKEQWGARPHTLRWHYWLARGGNLPQVNPKNPKYRVAIATWQHLPLGLTRWAGPKIVKYIP